MKIAGSGSASGSISQRHGSADPDLHKNVMDPQLLSEAIRTKTSGALYSHSIECVLQTLGLCECVCAVLGFIQISPC